MGAFGSFVADFSNGFDFSFSDFKSDLACLLLTSRSASGFLRNGSRGDEFGVVSDANRGNSNACNPMDNTQGANALGTRPLDVVARLVIRALKSARRQFSVPASICH